MRNKAEALRRGTSSSRTVSPSMHIQRDTFGQACIRSTNLSCRFFSTCTLSTVRKYPDDWLVEPVATDNSTRRVVREKLVVNSVCRRGQFSSNENWSSQPDKGKRVLETTPAHVLVQLNEGGSLFYAFKKIHMMGKFDFSYLIGI